MSVLLISLATEMIIILTADKVNSTIDSPKEWTFIAVFIILFLVQIANIIAAIVIIPHMKKLLQTRPQCQSGMCNEEDRSA